MKIQPKNVTKSLLRLFQPNTYAKNVISMPQQLLNRSQPYLLMHLITEILIIMTTVNFVTLLSDNFLALSKSVIGLQKINKTNKSISVAAQHLNL